MTRRVQLLLAVGIVVLSGFECFRAYPSLPDPMASNFGREGVPGGWSSKKSFLTLHGVSLGFWLGALLAARALAANAGQNFDGSTRRWLGDSIGWFLVASMAFSATVTHWVFEANLEAGRLSDRFGWLLAIYIGYVLAWTVRLIQRVRRESHRG
jgi:hypothetical protein